MKTGGVGDTAGGRAREGGMQRVCWALALGGVLEPRGVVGFGRVFRGGGRGVVGWAARGERGLIAGFATFLVCRVKKKRENES